MSGLVDCPRCENIMVPDVEGDTLIWICRDCGYTDKLIKCPKCGGNMAPDGEGDNYGTIWICTKCNFEENEDNLP